MDTWAQHLVAPVVVGVVMLLGQLWIQPKIAEAESIVESLLTNAFKPGTLLYGTVRRVVERLR